MISSVSAPLHLLPDRPRGISRGPSSHAPKRVEAAPKPKDLRRDRHQGPSVPFMAQLLAQQDDGAQQSVPAGKIRSYPNHSHDDVFGRGVDILPMNFRLIDLRV